jgi:hypothetical protein
MDVSPILRPENRTLKPVCDCGAVTAFFEGRHDIVLAEL